MTRILLISGAKSVLYIIAHVHCHAPVRRRRVWCIIYHKRRAKTALHSTVFRFGGLASHQCVLGPPARLSLRLPSGRERSGVESSLSRGDRGTEHRMTYGTVSNRDAKSTRDSLSGRNTAKSYAVYDTNDKLIVALHAPLGSTRVLHPSRPYPIPNPIRQRHPSLRVPRSLRKRILDR